MAVDFLTQVSEFTGRFHGTRKKMAQILSLPPVSSLSKGIEGASEVAVSVDSTRGLAYIHALV
jgi:hypothetical protein